MRQRILGVVVTVAFCCSTGCGSPSTTESAAVERAVGSTAANAGSSSTDGANPDDDCTWKGPNPTFEQFRDRILQIQERGNALQRKYNPGVSPGDINSLTQIVSDPEVLRPDVEGIPPGGFARYTAEVCKARQPAAENSDVSPPSGIRPEEFILAQQTAKVVNANLGFLNAGGALLLQCSPLRIGGGTAAAAARDNPGSDLSGVAKVVELLCPQYLG